MTTPGRMMIAQILPKHPNVPFELINKQLTKKNISDVIDAVYRHCGQKECVIFADRLMGLGFGQACKAGISFGKDDLIIPVEKDELIRHTTAEVKEFEQQYQDGLITAGERYNKVVDAWSRCTDEVATAMMKEISKQEIGVKTNSVWMMSHSGARGSPAQMRQLAGMRGLMAKPSGEIIEQPIIANFKEGLSVLEYFNSTHGARKGLADTALKTANSGYLTRRLVDVAQDCIIVEEDCGTDRGLTVRAVMDGGEVVSALSERILGRTAAEDVLDPVSNAVIVPGNTLIEEDAADQIERSGVEAVKIRSVLTSSPGRRVRPLLWARPRPWHAGEHRRGGGRDRGAVDRRAWHAAYHADLPYRWCGAAWRRAVERGGKSRRRGDGQEPQRRDEQPGHAGGDVAQLRNRPG